MERKGLASQKINGKTAVIVLIIVAIPAFFWFRFLYNTYVVDSVSPEMAKMRDMMMQPHPTSTPVTSKKQADPKSSTTKKFSEEKGEKGEKADR